MIRAAPAVAVSTDAWTSRATQSYASNTANFISDAWTLESYVVQTLLFPGHHTAVNIADHATAASATFNPDKAKVVAAVHNEGANMVAAGSILQEKFDWANEACGAHWLQTGVKHAIPSVREVKVLLSDSHNLVAHFHHSSLAIEALVKEQKGTTSVRFIQDCTTRRASSFYMLERLLALKVPVIVMLDQDPKKDMRQLALKTSQWELAKEISRILDRLEKPKDVLGEISM